MSVGMDAQDRPPKDHSPTEPATRPPLVVIVLLSWNQKEDTLQCLESLHTITYPSARILVVDNGSEDGTGDRRTVS